jgi:outer membrane protein OmpA-like peptidoglycan-associated protein
MHHSKKESFFWTSYADLMTSLFFIMLVLFVLTLALQYRTLEVTKKQLNDIKIVEKSTEDLDKDYFEYRSDYKKYILKVRCQFAENSYDIFQLSQETRDSLFQSGLVINNFLMGHEDTKYLLIIEGQASKNSEPWMQYNYDLSFRRARSLMEYWINGCHIEFGSNCEIQISGSGDGRLNVSSMRENTEENNQRFLIHIIPKNILDPTKEDDDY